MTDCWLPSTTPSRTTCTTNNQLQIVLHLSCEYGLSPPHLAAILPTVIVHSNILLRHLPQPPSRTASTNTARRCHTSKASWRWWRQWKWLKLSFTHPIYNKPRRAIFTTVSFSTNWSSRDYRANHESIHIAESSYRLGHLVTEKEQKQIKTEFTKGYYIAKQWGVRIERTRALTHSCPLRQQVREQTAALT